MQGAQRNVDYEDDTHFEIADFRETLTKCIEDENKIYGRKNKPREQDPTMFDLLSWQDKDEANWDFTKRDRNVVESNPVNHIKYKINKAGSPWVTENMDQFRKFTYSPSKKAVFFDLEDPTKGRPSASKRDTVTQELAQHLGKSPKDQNGYRKDVPSNASETLDKYAVKDLKNLKAVLKVIENRAIGKGGEVIQNPIAHQLTDHYGYEDEEERENRGNRGTDDEQDEERDEEESEDVQVDKANYTNVQSRLLTSYVKKAKELDPVYEKDRLKRREDRIQRLNETTRWLPNSAFKTYFGKAPFENYGRGNVNPTVGGSVYGGYMKTHNINPHAGDNKPEFKQVFDRAELAATTYPDNQPEPPRKCKDEIRLSQKQVDELKRRNPLVPEKFAGTSKNIIKPDLVNALRFASEENTPDNSFDEKAKSSKPKNLGETLKALNKTTKAIRKEIAKNSPTKVAPEKNKTSKKNKKQQEDFRRTQEALKQANQKAATAKKEAKETANQPETRKPQPQSETKQVKTQSRTNESQKKTKQTRDQEERDVAEDFDYSRGKGSSANNQQAQQRGKSNDSRGVKDLMNDPASSFNETLRTKGKVEVAKSPGKEVSFKQGLDNKSASKYREAPGAPQGQKDHDYGKVEQLQTLLRETQKNEKLWNKVNEDMNGTQNVDPMNPPKDYLFSLAQKETDPRYYKNVPPVWLSRIPYAGKKIERNDDIRGVFNACD